MVEKYNIGLDIGSASVGWAVTDEKAHLVKYKGKNLWGVSLFDEGETAAARRGYRSTRRRQERKKQRIKKLQEIFADDINQLDRNFFTRLKESFLQEDDCSIISLSTLFDDKKYSDKDYYKNYPTIYHLRRELINCNAKKDLRLVYLVIHHILKYRGNFLYGKADLTEFKSSVNENFTLIFTSLFNQEYSFTDETLSQVISVLTSNNSRSEKQDKLKSLLVVNDREIDTKIKEIVKAILGYKFDLIKLVGIDIEQNISSVTFKEEYEGDKVEEILGDKIEIFYALQGIYSWSVLEELLGDVQSDKPSDKTISNAMVVKYESHKRQLKMLKVLIRDICTKEDYSRVFRKEDKETNYTNYIKNSRKNKYFLNISKEHTLERFNSFIKKILDKYPAAKDHKYYSNIIELIEEKQLLARLNTKENSVIPYQLHKVELERILNSQGEYYPFLKENKELILKILESRLPYYIGPLNPKSSFSWVARIDKEKGIYPWNYDKYVDIDTTATEFIKRMTNKCTYLYDKDVLPRYSLIYSEFVLLNELNKVRINGRLIDNITKREIISDLFKNSNKKTVRAKDLEQWIKKNPKGFLLNNSEEIKIEGTQKENEFAASLASYVDFKKILGEVNESNFKMIEELISWITIFEDKEILRRKIKQRTDFQFDDATVEKIVRLRYKGWARLSGVLIDGIANNKDSKYIGQTILGIMRDTNDNFMQIINKSSFDFKERIDEINETIDMGRLTYEDIKGLHGSPAIKRGIWQGVKIIEEIVKVMGHEPENIFLEVARSDEESRRTISRVKSIESIYKTIKEDVGMYNKDTYNNLQKLLAEKNKLDNKALYLYFTQNGKCMYTGKQLDPENLNRYQIDHIIPQSFIKDDSLDNVVLVTTTENQLKGDSLFLNPEIRQAQKVFWENLFKYGLISKKKLDNLNRGHIPDRELIGFINRQLVETRQIIKHTADLLSEVYDNTKIMSIKARLTSDFREKYKLYKNRDLNDFHHAHDALIVSIIGNFTIKRYPKLEDELNVKKYIQWFKKTDSYKTNKGKYGFILSSMDNEYFTDSFKWNGNSEIERVKKALSYKDCFITKKVETKTGKFYDDTIYPSKHPKAKIPIKKGLNPQKYGGHSSENNSYYTVIEYVEKSKKIKKLVGIPIYVAYRDNNEELKDYLVQVECIKDRGSLRVIKDKIKKYQLVEYEGHRMYLVSHTEMQNAVQLIIDDQYKEMMFMINKNKDPESLTGYEPLMISFLDYYVGKINKHYPLFRKIGEELEDSKEDFAKLPIEEKVQFIKQMLKVTSVGPEKGDFKRFGTKIKNSEAGRIRNRSKGGWDITKMTFIDKSITGAYERSYKV